jgi:hypothetical protein
LTGNGWDSDWTFTGNDGRIWRGTVTLAQESEIVDMSLQIWRDRQ